MLSADSASVNNSATGVEVQRPFQRHRSRGCRLPTIFEFGRFLNYFVDHMDLKLVELFCEVGLVSGCGVQRQRTFAYGTRCCTQACLDCKGSILFTGIGKSGFIAQKIAQTLVSTGTKAVFLNPTDALHGDLGIVSSGDLVVVVSKSGSTEELVRLVPYARVRTDREGFAWPEAR